MGDYTQTAITDPALRALVEASECDYHGYGDGVEVLVNGAGSVRRVMVDVERAPAAAIVGAQLTTALNQALDRAEEAILNVLRGHPALEPQLTDIIGDGLPDSIPTMRGAELAGDFQGNAADGEVVAHVSGRSRRFVSIYLYRVSPELVSAVAEAANRALAAAELGSDGAVPLDDAIDATLARLDARLSSISSGLDQVEASLDETLAGLG